jgi:hypothetical protein
MDTWAIEAATHAALTSGYSMGRIPLSGSASLGGFTLGVTVAGLAFVAVNSPWKPRSPWTSADAWQYTVRWTRSAQPFAWLTRPRRVSPVALAEAVPVAGSGVAEPADASRPYSDASEPEDLAQVVSILSRADAVLGISSGGEYPDKPEATVRARSGHRKREPSRIRQRVGVMLEHVLSDTAGEQADRGQADQGRADRGQADRGHDAAVRDSEDEFWSPRQPVTDGFWPDEPDEPADETGRPEPSDGYRSKHRLPLPAEHPYDGELSPAQHRPAPRHAAPPASFSAKLTSISLAEPKLPRLVGKSSHAAF